LNTEIEKLYYDYLRVAGDDKPTAAILSGRPKITS
jgi:hypothetical protein